ncbi:hypothetical protein SASPL_127323 [Salvia splendens]|uniref:Transposase MuDR plant domain-containing protein n=1 Tax=Salvia splendens TaxID=180675 RepID=A0A8X8ZLQ3_SALSN|nr:hypothetical protein SASPL_127323 [Salvia splendens]
MDGDLGSDSDIDINLDELDDILTFEDSDFDLVDDINIDELNDGVDVIPLYVNVWEDERNGDGRDGMINESEFDENMDKEDEIWAEGEGEGEGSESDGMISIHSSDEEARISRWHVFNAKRDMKDPKFKHGMLFTNKEVLKQAIRQYAIVNKYNVKVVRNENDRVNANCLNCEGWMIRASTNKKEKAIQIKKFKDNHKCALEIPQRHITYKWLSETYIEHLGPDPKFSNKSLAHQLEVDFKTKTSRSKLWRARRHALEKVMKSEVEQYGKLRDYAEEPLVGLDGCFLKGGYKAQLLVDVGIDPNDCIFPIAYGVVDVESRESWTWFGLIAALDELMPHVEKRFCVRHLWKNLCRATTIKGSPELKDLLWNAAKTTYPAEYSRRMALMKKEDIKAWGWLENKPPENWSKSHFRDFSKCDILLNNHIESFNSYILEARDQQILTMLEVIRMKLMKRMCLKGKVAHKYTGAICPNIIKKLEKYKELSSNCWETKAGARKYSVAVWEKLYVVDLDAQTCSCCQ